jgi:hypothetical protein
MMSGMMVLLWYRLLVRLKRQWRHKCAVSSLCCG